MILRILIRLFLGGVAAVVLMIAAAGVSCWMALSEPSFYAELKAKSYTEADAQEVEDRLLAETQDIERWVVNSFVQPQGDVQPDLVQWQGSGGSSQPSPEAGVRSVTLSQDDLNALLSGGEHTGGDLQNVRVQILGDRIRLAGEIPAANDSPIVVSAEFRLTMNADEKLKLEILGGKIGRLPLPTTWLLQMIPQDQLAGDEKFEFRFNDPTPHILINVVDTENSPNLHGIRSADGEIQLDFTPPGQ